MMSSFRILKRVRCAMLFVNLLSVLLQAGNMIVASEYAVQNGLSREFIRMSVQVPCSSWVLFFLSAGLYLLMSAFLLHLDTAETFSLKSVMAILLAAAVILLLHGTCQGLILMVLAFLLPDQKSSQYSIKTVVLCIALYIGVQYDLLSLFLPMTDPSVYWRLYPQAIQNLFNLFVSLVSSLNVFLFIVYVCVYSLDQYQKNENIEKELEMVSAVNTELKNYAAITEKIGEDKERKRLAREIHDTLGHALTGIAAGIDACLVLVDKQPQVAKQQLEIVSKVVRQGIGDVRNSLNKLRPGALEENSFRDALEKMIGEFMEVSSLEINFDYKLESFDFDITKEDALFRIVQECITNALRHGHASEIWISMYSQGNHVILSIRDNGIGCEKVKVGYGLRQMKERVAIMGGQIFFDGSEGFLTIVSLPIQSGESRGIHE